MYSATTSTSPTSAARVSISSSDAEASEKIAPTPSASIKSAKSSNSPPLVTPVLDGHHRIEDDFTDDVAEQARGDDDDRQLGR